jgi:hypothetical protein
MMFIESVSHYGGWSKSSDRIDVVIYGKGKPRLSGLGLRPSGSDPTRRVQRSGLKKTGQL